MGQASVFTKEDANTKVWLKYKMYNIPRYSAGAKLIDGFKLEQGTLKEYLGNL